MPQRGDGPRTARTCPDARPAASTARQVRGNPWTATRQPVLGRSRTSGTDPAGRRPSTAEIPGNPPEKREGGIPLGGMGCRHMRAPVMGVSGRRIARINVRPTRAYATNLRGQIRTAVGNRYISPPPRHLDHPATRPLDHPATHYRR
ncbi:hypothetical protein MIPYR_80008 [uncultured Microbacterium sp.]|uniref:Uncharacterized protein n=1 Tax=uncultured Microbacterium sp. TaxID=191216 RepID=A0A1Y5PBX8_9MICO|nr:hypothetical protein MIPYR_80008 [uncultured Microbacterium sp.]